jgi:hypothetical protein
MKLPSTSRARRLSLLAIALALPVAAVAILPFPAPVAPNVYDYASYLFLNHTDCQGDHSDLPSNVDCGGTGDFQTTNYRDTTRIDTAHNPQELYGVVGPSTNLAWRITTGRPDVVIAVIDDGVQWDQSVSYLNRKYYINRRELPMPPGGPNPADTIFGGYDVNGDGVFNSIDYAGAVADLNGNGFVDPQDLIRTYSNSVDDDGNGYVDDIAGWDFYENDNDPNDDVDFSHGNGRSRDAVAEAGFDDGQCPNCMVMPLRVGDSFIADVNHYGEAAAYAADNGAHVIEDALGTLNHTSFGQAGTDYAYYHGVIINASEADEAAGHHNWPAAYEHTMVVNAIGDAGIDQAAVPNSFLHLLGCTNFGGYSFVSIPGVKCSSEAAGRSAGVSGLLVSAAKNAIDRGDMTRYIRDDGSLASFPLSGEEMKQLWRLAADDIDFSSPCPDHAFCDEPPPDVPFPVAPPNNYAINTPDSIRYQSVRGWDYFTGYGRENAYRLVSFIGIEGDPVAGNREYVGPGSTAVGSSPLLSAQDRIPPEADITSPRWWGQFPYKPDYTLLDPQGESAIVVTGRAAANRVTAAGGTFGWVLEWAPHVQGQKHPLGSLQGAAGSEEKSGGPWTTVASQSGLTSAYVGVLGQIPVAALASALGSTPNPFDPATDPTSEFQPERYAIRLRLRVIADPVNPADTINNEAVMQKQIDVYPASETVIRHDLGVNGKIADGSGSPSFHDLNGDGVDELLVFGGDGLIHAYRDVSSGAELPGWPVKTGAFHGIRAIGANAYTNGGMPTEAYDSLLAGTPGVADLDDDGRLEVVVADLEGRVHVFEADGSARAGLPGAGGSRALAAAAVQRGDDPRVRRARAVAGAGSAQQARPRHQLGACDRKSRSGLSGARDRRRLARQPRLRVAPGWHARAGLARRAARSRQGRDDGSRHAQLHARRRSGPGARRHQGDRVTEPGRPRRRRQARGRRRRERAVRRGSERRARARARGARLPGRAGQRAHLRAAPRRREPSGHARAERDAAHAGPGLRLRLAGADRGDPDRPPARRRHRHERPVAARRHRRRRRSRDRHRERGRTGLHPEPRRHVVPRQRRRRQVPHARDQRRRRERRAELHRGRRARGRVARRRSAPVGAGAGRRTQARARRRDPRAAARRPGSLRVLERDHGQLRAELADRRERPAVLHRSDRGRHHRRRARRGDPGLGGLGHRCGRTRDPVGGRDALPQRRLDGELCGPRRRAARRERGRDALARDHDARGLPARLSDRGRRGQRSRMHRALGVAAVRPRCAQLGQLRERRRAAVSAPRGQRAGGGCWARP